jgi:hypothetical protein
VMRSWIESPPHRENILHRRPMPAPCRGRGALGGTTCRNPRVPPCRSRA